MVPRGGIEPPTRGFSIRCSTDWAIEAKEWCRLPESNWWPTDYKSVALPTELSRHTKFFMLLSVLLLPVKEFRHQQIKLWCPEAESNHRHEDFQSSALPTELSGQRSAIKRIFCITVNTFFENNQKKRSLVVFLFKSEAYVLPWLKSFLNFVTFSKYRRDSLFGCFFVSAQ